MISVDPRQTLKVVTAWAALLAPVAVSGCKSKTEKGGGSDTPAGAIEPDRTKNVQQQPPVKQTPVIGGGSAPVAGNQAFSGAVPPPKVNLPEAPPEQVALEKTVRFADLKGKITRWDLAKAATVVVTDVPSDFVVVARTEVSSGAAADRPVVPRSTTFFSEKIGSAKVERRSDGRIIYLVASDAEASIVTFDAVHDPVKVSSIAKANAEPSAPTVSSNVIIAGFVKTPTSSKLSDLVTPKVIEFGAGRMHFIRVPSATVVKLDHSTAKTASGGLELKSVTISDTPSGKSVYYPYQVRTAGGSNHFSVVWVQSGPDTRDYIILTPDASDEVVKGELSFVSNNTLMLKFPSPLASRTVPVAARKE